MGSSVAGKAGHNIATRKKKKKKRLRSKLYAHLRRRVSPGCVLRLSSAREKRLKFRERDRELNISVIRLYSPPPTFLNLRISILLVCVAGRRFSTSAAAIEPLGLQEPPHQRGREGFTVFWFLRALGHCSAARKASLVTG